MMDELGSEMAVMDIAMKIHEDGRDDDLAVFVSSSMGFLV